jgi:Fe-S cluster biogenesis protein NfuA
MFIQTVETPNPETLKFVPGVDVLSSGTASYVRGDGVNDSPLVDALFKINGLQAVFLGKDFVSVTKDTEQDWEYLKPLALACIMDHFMAGMPVVLDSAKRVAKNQPENLDAVTKQIIEIIETRVRPAVAQDGGDIIFQDFSDGIVYLELQGACSGCPSSTITLKDGIENMLKHYIPEVEEVRAV